MKQILSDTLPLFMVPVLQIVHEFPRLVNGKIDRQALITTFEKSEVLTLAYTNDELEPLENEADRTRARVILTSIGIFFAHLSKAGVNILPPNDKLFPDGFFPHHKLFPSNK